jgi:hypothetical protein
MGATDYRPVKLLEDMERENLGDYSSAIGSNTIVQQGDSSSNPNSFSNNTSVSTSFVPTNTVKIYIEQDLINILSLASEFPSANSTLDTESFYKSNDLLCEGPIEGLVDQDGNTLNYIDLSSSIKDRSSSLAYGVYYNDISVKDKKTNLLNLTAANFNLSLGNEVNNFNDISSSVYTYDSKVYDLDQDPGIASFNGLDQKYIGDPFTNSTEIGLYKNLIFLKNKARNFSHYVKNKYITSATVNIKIDSCFYIGGKGDTYGNNIRFVVCVTNLTERVTNYFYFQAYFVAKGNPVIIPIQIQFNRAANLSSNSPEYLINVYSVEKRITAFGEKNRTATNNSRSFAVDSIVEKVDYAFSYPYSAVCQNIVSAKHFSNIPVRSFDCKLLKIKVPNNYDPDAREYVGDWNGDFSKLLRWSDNPAWIFYDLCVNGRYGLAKSSMSESDLNKWELYRISKYCDELVITNAATKYKEDVFQFDNSILLNQTDYNTITFTSIENLNTLQTRYPEKSILYLYDLKNELNESININFKKIILSVNKVGNTVKIKLCNDFGVRKFIESDISGRFYNSLKQYISGNPSVLNTEDNAKNYAISYLANISNPVNNQYNSSSEQVSVSYRNEKIFDNSLKVASGKCVAKHPEYDDFLEPRFSANIYINDATEGLKILTDLSSVFRGIFYFKNGLLNLNSDVKKPTSYVFTNSNVKDGFFNYTSSNLESSFSVAKVSYLDKKDNFKDKVVYIEDANLIKKYGLIEKEILGFGITSKYQAERIGKWFLTTGKLESQTVTFTTGIEATLLKIGDIVRVADNLKNSKLEFGKITALDFKNNYVYIDREMKNDVLGKRIKVLSIVGDETLESTLSIFEANNSDLRLTLLPYDYFSWNLKNKTVSTNNGRTLSSDFVSAAAWDKKAFTAQSYIDNCLLSFKVEFTSSILVCGLSSKNIVINDSTDIEYGFYINSGNLLGIFPGHTDIGSAFNFGKTITSSDLLSISYDGNYITFYLNGKSLTDQIGRPKGNPLLAVAAFNTQFTTINEIIFSRYPLPSYGSFSNLRADANFSIYLENDAEQEDLYRIIGVNESSTNDYGITALKYSPEKFEVVDKNEYVDENQYNKKQIVFATDDYIRPAFSDSIINNNIKQTTLSFVEANNTNFDYSFNIETEVLTDSFNLSNYLSIEINFITLFSRLDNSPYVYGIYCTIIKDGKVLKFKQFKNEASKVSIFLGDNITLQNSSGVSFDVDLYAFDSNMRLINV